MTAHDLLDGFARLVGVIERDRGDVVVQDVSLNDAVHQLSADKPKLAIDSGSGATNVSPRLGRVVRESGISVLEEGNGDCTTGQRYSNYQPGGLDLPSQWLTQR